MTESQLVSRCLVPCRVDAEGGTEVRSLPAYEALRAEIDKLEDPRGAMPDWALVEARGAALLCECGKDLFVACYVAWARHQRGGPEGLHEGLALVERLIATFGETLHPKRDRARIAALAWLLARLETIANDVIPASTATALASALQRLQTVATCLLGDGAPSFAHVARRMRAVGDARQEPPPPPEVVAPMPAVAITRTATAEPKASVDGGSLVPSLDTPAQRRSFLARTAHLLHALAARCLSEDLADPRGYRLARIAGSLLFEEPPAANERGRTELDPPGARRLRALHKAREAGAFRDVVTISESLLAQQPLWLDGHWITAQALTALGGSYDAARAVVVREGRGLWARLPGLAQLMFADGSALGSPEACDWLAPRDPSASETSGSERQAPSAGGTASALIARVVADDPDACRAFERAVRARSPRRGFQLRLALARQLERAKKSASAARIYAGLERDLDAYRIDLWDPDLARAVVLGLSRTLPALTPHGVRDVDLVRVSARAAQLAPTLCL